MYLYSTGFHLVKQIQFTKNHFFSNYSDLIEKSRDKETSPSSLQQEHSQQKQKHEMPPQIPKIKSDATQLVPINNSQFALPNGGSTNYINNLSTEVALPRRPSALLQEILTTRRPSAIMAALTRPSQNQLVAQRQIIPMGSLYEDPQASGSSRSFNNMFINNTGPNNVLALESRRENRRIGE